MDIKLYGEERAVAIKRGESVNLQHAVQNFVRNHIGDYLLLYSMKHLAVSFFPK
jgi:hypothetical protein